MTLYELLTSFDDIKRFELAKKLKIFILSSETLDLFKADVKEYYLSDVPIYLLCKKVLKVNYDENEIVVF